MSARRTPVTATARRRLQSQAIQDARFDAPEQAVSWLLAMQAQDYLAALWAVGLRVHGATEVAVEAAIGDGRLVRTWPLRGTLHLVAAEDARWLLDLLAPRAIARDQARIERDFGLDAKVLAKCRRVVARALRDGTPMRRNDLYAALEAGGIASAQQRGVHITGRLAQEGLICGGPRDGRQPTFVLLDAWAPHAVRKPRDASLAELALRYFASRGPATAQDLAWWSGLTVRDAEAAVNLAGADLVQEMIDSKAYWRAVNQASSLHAKAVSAAHLLPAFDEYLVGYRDRTAVLDIANNRAVVSTNGLVGASIVIDGRVAGVWKRTLGKTSVSVALQPFAPLPEARLPALRAVARRYGAFLGLSVEFV